MVMRPHFLNTAPERNEDLCFGHHWDRAELSFTLAKRMKYGMIASLAAQPKGGCFSFDEPDQWLDVNRYLPQTGA